MSFSSTVKEEICRQKLDRRCCAIAESCGVLLYCHTFSPEVIRISTSSALFAVRLPKLFRKAFGFSFDVLPPEDAVGRRSLLITDKTKISSIFEAFGGDRATAVSHHVNFAKPLATATRAEPIIPNAIPMAAKTTANVV